MREYRKSNAGLYIGLPFTLFASIFPGIVVWQLATGRRVMVGRSYNPGGIHPMSSWEMLEFGLLGACLVAFGVLAILDWKNSVIQTSESGIRKLNTFRKVIFSAEWSELKSATKRKGENGRIFYALSTGGNELLIPDTSRLAELRKQIVAAAPQVNFSHWRSF